MRRALALLIAIVLPLKALGAVVVPITGAPNHAHAGHAQVHVVGDAGAHEASPVHLVCAGMSDHSPSDAGTLHDHGCPHLAMATMVPAQPSMEIDGRVTLAPPRVVPSFVSVVLDLPVPPPTRRS